MWIDLFTIAPLIAILFNIAVIVFVIWYLIRFLKLQQERNTILKSISEKLDSLKK